MSQKSRYVDIESLRDKAVRGTNDKIFKQGDKRRVLSHFLEKPKAKEATMKWISEHRNKNEISYEVSTTLAKNSSFFVDRRMRDNSMLSTNASFMNQSNPMVQ